VTTLTPKESWQAKFLKAMEKRPIVARACKVANVSRQTAYVYREQDPEFAAAWDEAKQNGIDALEEIAWERAETVSDTLMIFILKGQRPEVYGDQARISFNVGRMSDDELIAAAIDATAAGHLPGNGKAGSEDPAPSLPPGP
jgi:hypothetical protein